MEFEQLQCVVLFLTAIDNKNYCKIIIIIIIVICWIGTNNKYIAKGNQWNQWPTDQRFNAFAANIVDAVGDQIDRATEQPSNRSSKRQID